MMKKTLMVVLVAAIVGCVKAGDCRDGLLDGKYACKDELSGDRDNCGGIEDRCEAVIDDRFTIEARDDPSVRRYKRCGQKGVKKAIRDIKTECAENAYADECNDLGEDAAEKLAVDLCESMEAPFSHNSHTESTYECREMAIDICQGMIATKFYNFCDGKRISRKKLWDAKRKCRRTVDRLLEV